MRRVNVMNRQTIRTNEWLLSLSSSRRLDLAQDDGFGVDGHVLGGVVRLIDADEPVGHLKHVVPQGDDDELSVLGLLLQ